MKEEYKGEEKEKKMKQEEIIIAIKRKKDNYELFKRGIKNCLTCGWRSKKENVTYGTFNLCSSCSGCKSQSWLVGDNYPCEICNRMKLCLGYSQFKNHVTKIFTAMNSKNK